jgi:Capsule assembly protein Wzi
VYEFWGLTFLAKAPIMRLNINCFYLSEKQNVLRNYKSYLATIFLFFTLVPNINAAPWIDVGDLRLRNNLQLLNDSGAMSVSLTTWPLMWADVRRALDTVDHSKLSGTQASAVRELRFELRKQTGKVSKSSVEFVAATSRALLRDFGSFQREKGEIHKRLEWDGDSVAARLQVNVMTEPGEDVVDTDFYGSYLAGVLGGKSGNWVLGVGAIDRWWGAGSQSSLILTNNAGPVPGVFLRTKQGQHFETPLLSWLGEWHFTSFIGQLESNRVVPKAKLTGMRFTFSPVHGLEFGLSRAMQWGGEGRDEDLSTFWKSLTSQGENESGDSGNQLAGFDVRYGVSVSDSLSLALHAQTIGEDEAGYMPARRTHQFGVQALQDLSSGSFLRYELEYTNTTADAFETVIPNITYEHSVYQSGYRHRGRSLGASFDNDSEVVSLGVAYQQANGSLNSLRLSYLQLNEDGDARGNTVSSTANNLYLAELFHQCFVFDGRLKAGFSYLSQPLDTAFVDVERFAASVSWEYRY